MESVALWDKLSYPLQKALQKRKMYMEISVKPLVRGEQRSVQFSYSIPLDYSENGYELASEAEINGEIKDMGGYMQLDADCTVSYRTQCARCLKALEGECSIRFTRPIAMKLESDNDEEEYLLVNENTAISIDEAVTEELYLSLPTRSLCNDDCKGLCIKCGCNKNERECSCVTKEIDPRWAALKNFKAKE